MSYNQRPCSCARNLHAYYDPRDFLAASPFTSPSDVRLNMVAMYDTKALGDCAYKDYCECRHPIQRPGTPYDMYHFDGTVKKSLPLTLRPPLNQKLPCAQGYLLRDPTNLSISRTY